jgi:hypothetical protein
MKLLSPDVCCSTDFKRLAILSQPLASGSERVAFPLVERRVASSAFTTLASMSILSKSIFPDSISSWVNPVSEKSLKSRGRSLRALKELFVADWVGVDLEDPPGENLAEKAISAGGSCVGASTLANRGYIRWSVVWGALVDGNWWFLRKYTFT